MDWPVIMLRERSTSDPRLDLGLRIPRGFEVGAARPGDSVGPSNGDGARLLSDSTYDVNFSRTRRRASAIWLANSTVSSSSMGMLGGSSAEGGGGGTSRVGGASSSRLGDAGSETRPGLAGVHSDSEDGQAVNLERASFAAGGATVELRLKP